MLHGLFFQRPNLLLSLHVSLHFCVLDFPSVYTLQHMRPPPLLDFFLCPDSPPPPISVSFLWVPHAHLLPFRNLAYPSLYISSHSLAWCHEFSLPRAPVGEYSQPARFFKRPDFSFSLNKRP